MYICVCLSVCLSIVECNLVCPSGVAVDVCDVISSSGGFHDSFPRISSRRSVHQKESFVRSFVRSFSRVSGSGESFSESFRLTSSLRPSFSFANRKCQPSRLDSLPPSAPRSRSRIANASRVGQTHFLPRSQHSNETRNHDSQSCNGANGYQSNQTQRDAGGGGRSRLLDV